MDVCYKRTVAPDLGLLPPHPSMRAPFPRRANPRIRRLGAVLAALALGSGCGSSEQTAAVPPGEQAPDEGEPADEPADGTTNDGFDPANGYYFSVTENDGAAGFDQCATSEQAGVLLPANLLFVVDRSGSMNCNPPDGDAAANELCKTEPVKQDLARPSKWEITRDALMLTLANLGARSHISAGLSVFPKPDPVQGCLVEAAPDVPIQKLDLTQLATLDTFLDGVAPSGDTPVAGATILSYSYLAEEIRQQNLTGNTFVVLFTDGAETCEPSYLERLVDRDAQNATLFDIRTFAIGAPGSEEGRSVLSALAFAGLTPRTADCSHADSDVSLGNCHYDMTTSSDFAAELSSALGAITGDASLACEFDLPQNPEGGAVDLEKVNVTFAPGLADEITVLRDDSSCSESAQGWQYSADRSKIVLCGSICDQVRADISGQVRIVLGCPTARLR
jgi:hypothetical protein